MNKILTKTVLSYGNAIIYDWMHDYGEYSNLCLQTNDGIIKWYAQIDGEDSYVGVAERNGKIIAQTFNCFTVELDPEDGRILKSSPGK